MYLLFEINKLFFKSEKWYMILNEVFEMDLLKREIYSYAVAAVNFYGLIPLRKLAEIINGYHNTQYQSKDLEAILESYINEESVVQKVGRLLYQKQIFEDTNVRDVYEVLKMKPYYIPPTSEEFLKYIQASYYELPEEFDVLKDFYNRWLLNEDMAFLMAKDAVMAFNVDCPITDIYEATLARINDYLKLTNSDFMFDDQSRNLMIIALINLNSAIRKISLRGYSANEINQQKNYDEED